MQPKDLDWHCASAVFQTQRVKIFPIFPLHWPRAAPLKPTAPTPD